MGGKWSKEAKILRSLRSKSEVKTPIATEMFIPNHSGISSHPEADQAFLRKDKDDTTEYNLTVNRLNIDSIAPYLILKDTNSTGSGVQSTVLFSDKDDTTVGTFGFTSPTNADFYVHSASGKVRILGTEMNLNSKKITSLADPTSDQDAATKKYVDDNDSDTTYSAGDGLDLTSTTFSLDLKSGGGLKIDSTELALSGTKFVSITIEDPTSSEDITICRFNEAVTITKVVGVVVGSSTPSVTINPKHHTDRSNAGNALFSSAQAVTSTTTGDVDTSFSDATIPADSFLWLETTAKSGTVDELNITFFYTTD